VGSLQEFETFGIIGATRKKRERSCATRFRRFVSNRFDLPKSPWKSNASSFHRYCHHRAPTSLLRPATQFELDFTIATALATTFRRSRTSATRGRKKKRKKELNRHSASTLATSPLPKKSPHTKLYNTSLYINLSCSIFFCHFCDFRLLKKTPYWRSSRYPLNVEPTKDLVFEKEEKPRETGPFPPLMAVTSGPHFHRTRNIPCGCGHPRSQYSIVYIYNFWDARVYYIYCVSIYMYMHIFKYIFNIYICIKYILNIYIYISHLTGFFSLPASLG